MTKEKKEIDLMVYHRIQLSLNVNTRANKALYSFRIVIRRATKGPIDASRTVKTKRKILGLVE